jgi:hypothetical protein
MISKGVTGMTSRLDRAVLALANQRGSGQDQGDQGDTVDDRHHPGEPGLLQGRVEAHPRHEIDRRRCAAPAALNELRHLTDDDLLRVAAAREGLAHARRIHVELDFRTSVAQDVALKVNGNDECKSELAAIHARIDPIERYHRRLTEAGREEGTGNPSGQGRVILVHDRDGRVGECIGSRASRAVDRQGESEDEQRDHHRIARDAPQLLHAKPVDVGETPHLRHPAFSATRSTRRR